MEAAIKISNLSVSYNNEDAVSNLNLEIKKGEFVYIIGPNGGGKTTLIKSVLGLLPPHSGEIQLLGQSVSKGRQKIGYVPQKAETEKGFPITVIETVETAFLKSGLNPFKRINSEEKDKTQEILKDLGLEALKDHQINSLSGGELQRVLIARALARDPEILILDEPCANTDTASSHKIHEILEKKHREGVTVLVVSHDINHVLDSKTRTVFINKEILFDGIADEKILKL